MGIYVSHPVRPENDFKYGLILFVIVFVLVIVGALVTLRQATNGLVPMSSVENGSSSLSVVQNKGLQPFGLSHEDELTASEAVFKTGYYNPQTTVNAKFIQASK